MAEFFAMGGYAAYVWSAFGFTILVLAGLWLLSWRKMRRKEAEVEALRTRLRAQRPARQPGVIRARRDSTPGAEG
ncbi:MAG TPA: heme exporter protein CcmD [Geminicoccus sp.]|jgi:heme exporter protein D|uniref:heme exporter protein CcmD n=1 Tax=Geminicoccus sp. TaxID=2024832 RepID=UPI002E381C78|nr:heme exporter protein CcmD [Geminicoccus sp.]HEX2526274.1 heme exporter protein CcmD [Geminicoccus sp.]